MAKAKLKSALEEVTAAIAPADASYSLTAAEMLAADALVAAPAVAAPVALVPTPAPVPAPVQPALRPAIMGQGFGLEEHKARTWRATLTETQTMADAADPTFWRQQVDLMMGQNKQSGRGDIIRVFKPDTSEFAELLIVEIGKGFCRTQVIREVAPEGVKLADGCPFKIQWNASRKAHDVVRKADNAAMTGGFQSQAAAAAWIINHLKAMAA